MIKPLTFIIFLVVFSVGCGSQNFNDARSGLNYGAAAPNKQMQRVLSALSSLDPKPIETLTATEARRQPTPTDAIYQVIQDMGETQPPRLPPVARVEMKAITAPGQLSIPLRVYTPEGSGPFPIVVYFHGGGWVIGNLDTYDSSARALSTLSKSVVVSVDYRKAPEAKFPTAHEDSYAAFQYVAAHSSEFDGDGSNISVAGESAGGNLANGVSLLAIERGGVIPKHQVLVYPITNYGFETASYKANTDTKPLNAAMMRWFFDNYLSSSKDGASPLISPLTAPAAWLKQLPPTTIITAEVDPLRSEGLAYADKLRECGVRVSEKDFKGVSHEFFGMASLVDEALDAEEFAAKELRASFKK